MELDAQQQIAVETDSPRALVLAGAGSGKTRVLIERIAHLIENKHVSSYEILAISFTRKSAQEMRTRLEERIGSAAFHVNMGTMHAQALSMIRRFGDTVGIRPKSLTVYSDWENNFLLKEIAIEMGVYKGKVWKIPYKKEIAPLFADYYERGIEPNPLAKGYPLFKAFMARCRKNNSMPYGGLLFGLELLIPVMAKHLHIRHILVDEVQDLDPLQWRIINAMVEAFGAKLFVVGDIDQSIYSFRGAVPEYLVDHADDFDIYRLEMNYRSDRNVVTAANTLIEHNQNRLEKTMQAFEDAQTPIDVIKNVDSDAMVGLIKSKLDGGQAAEGIAVLSPVHALLKKLSQMLTDADVPHTYAGKKSELTRSEGFRRFHAFLKLLVNPYDNFSFLLIRDMVGLSIGDYKKIRFAALNQGKSHFQAWMSTPTLKGAGWQSWFEESYDYSMETVSWALGKRLYGAEESEPFLFIKEWIGGNPHGNIKEYLDWLTTYDLQDEIEEKNEGVLLSTIHGAKGLEFPSVIIAGVNEGLLPSKRAIQNEELEDTRRLAYVAWTRAEDKLIIAVRPESKEDARGHVHVNPISRFVAESGL